MQNAMSDGERVRGPSIKDVRTDGFATKEGGRCSKGGCTNLLLSRFIPNAEKGRGPKYQDFGGRHLWTAPSERARLHFVRCQRRRERERATGNDFFYLALIAIAILEEDEVE